MNIDELKLKVESMEKEALLYYRTLYNFLQQTITAFTLENKAQKLPLLNGNL